MSDKRKQLIFKIIEFTVYFIEAIGYCMLVNFLTDIGYNATQRSIMFAFGSALAIGIQAVVGYLCDKHKTIKRYSLLFNILYAAVVFLTYTYSKMNFLMHMLFIGGNVICFKILGGLYDSWVLESGEKCRNNYGKIRAYGSIGWAVGSVIVSKIVVGFGYSGIAYFFAGFMVIALVVSFLMDDAIKEKSEKVTLADVKEMMANKRYIILIIACFFAYFMMNALDYTIVDKINFLNGTEQQISYFWSICALMELPLLFYGNKLIEIFGSVKLFIFAMAVFFIRFIIYGLATSVNVVLISCILQGLTFPIVLVVVKDLIDKESPENMKSSGQQIGMAIYANFSSLITPVVAGVIEDMFSINVALYFVSCFAILSIIFVILYVKVKKSSLD